MCVGEVKIILKAKYMGFGSLRRVARDTGTDIKLLNHNMYYAKPDTESIEVVRGQACSLVLGTKEQTPYNSDQSLLELSVVIVQFHPALHFLRISKS
jgi:hypothetical protein